MNRENFGVDNRPSPEKRELMSIIYQSLEKKIRRVEGRREKTFSLNPLLFFKHALTSVASQRGFQNEYDNDDH